MKKYIVVLFAAAISGCAQFAEMEAAREAGSAYLTGRFDEQICELETIAKASPELGYSTVRIVHEVIPPVAGSGTSWTLRTKYTPPQAKIRYYGSKVEYPTTKEDLDAWMKTVDDNIAKLKNKLSVKTTAVKRVQEERTPEVKPSKEDRVLAHEKSTKKSLSQLGGKVDAIKRSVLPVPEYSTATLEVPRKFIRHGRVLLFTDRGNIYCDLNGLKPGDFKPTVKNGVDCLEATPQWYAKRDAEEKKRKEAERVAEAKRQEEERVSKELASAEEGKRKEAERVAKELAAAEEARRKEAERVAQAKRREARLARQAAYEKARSEAWENFNLAISKTVHPALSASKEFLPGAYSELNASVDLVQNGFRGLPKDEDDTGASAKKLAEWQEEVSKLLQNASRTHLAVEKRQEEIARAEAEQILANRARLSALHKTRRQNGASEFTNRVVWATRNCLWDTEREVAVEVMRRTGLSLKDCTPPKKSFPSQRVKFLEAPIGYKYEFGSLSATGQVFLVSAECLMEHDSTKSVADVLADIKKFYQFPDDARENEERTITGHNLDSPNLSPWAIYQYNYFTSRMNSNNEKARKGRENVICRYLIKPYEQTITTISCDGYDIVVRSDQKGERVMSVKAIDMVAYSELMKSAK